MDTLAEVQGHVTRLTVDSVLGQEGGQGTPAKKTGKVRWWPEAPRRPRQVLLVLAAALCGRGGPEENQREIIRNHRKIKGKSREHS